MTRMGRNEGAVLLLIVLFASLIVFAVAGVALHDLFVRLGASLTTPGAV